MSYLGMFTGALFALIYIFLVVWDHIVNPKVRKKSTKVEKTLLIYDPLYLTGFLAVAVGSIILSVFMRPQKIWTIWIPLIFSVLVFILVYDTLLLILLPFIRKYFSPFFVYTTWMLSDVLFVLFYGQRILNADNIGTNLSLPKFVFVITKSQTKILILIWLAGVIGLLGWKIHVHNVFRKQLMEGAELIKDENILACFEKCKAEFSRLPKKLSIYWSDHTNTPLTIGIEGETVLLPRKNYSNEELKWIFYHEMMHIDNRDSALKFFIALSNALFWFVPTMWILSSKVAEDIELNCDELVLTKESEKDRRFYANLILKSGGDARGFTTCLSATGESFRYRLKKIMHPQKRKVVIETLLSALIILLALTSLGFVQISYKKGVGKDMLFDNKVSKIEIQEASYYANPHNYINDEGKSCKVDKEELKELLENATFLYLPGMDDASDSFTYRVNIKVDGRQCTLNFSGHCVEVCDYDENGVDKVYYMPDKNWEKLFS